MTITGETPTLKQSRLNAYKAYDETLSWEALLPGGDWHDLTHTGCPIYFLHQNPKALIRIKAKDNETE